MGEAGSGNAGGYVEKSFLECDSINEVIRLSEGTVYARWTKREISLLLAKGKASGNTIKLTWLKENGATGYEVYWSYCDGKGNYKKLAATKKLAYTVKSLKQNKKYKFYVRACRYVGGKKEYLANHRFFMWQCPKPG